MKLKRERRNGGRAEGLCAPSRGEERRRLISVASLVRSRDLRSVACRLCPQSSPACAVRPLDGALASGGAAVRDHSMRGCRSSGARRPKSHCAGPTRRQVGIVTTETKQIIDCKVVMYLAAP